MTQALIYDVGIENFVSEVLQKSQEVPVMVDFWAEWCGPCKSLTPVLEKLARAYQGRFVLAKCNTEENPDIAAKLRIRSIPAIKLFVGGKLAGEFMGVQPEAEIRRFIEHYCPAAAKDPFLEAQELAEQGQIDESQIILSRLLSSQPEQNKARHLLVRLLLQEKKMAEAVAVMQGFPAESPELASLAQMLNLYKEAQAYPSLPDLENAIIREPSNLEGLYRLAVRLASETRFQDALDRLIQVLQRDKNFGEGKARKTMLALFELIGLHHPLSEQYRRQMARIIL